MVTITGIGNGTCQLTGKEGDGVFCEFTKGSDFKGFLIWASLKQLVVMHATQNDGHSEPADLDYPLIG